MPFLRNVVRGPRRARGAAGRGGRALPALRRRLADQRTVSGPARCVTAGAGRGRDRPAALLGQPQLAPVPARRRSPRMASDGVRRALAFVDQPVRLVLLLPAVPGRHRGGPGGGRAGRPGDRQDPALPRPPGLRRGRTPTPYGRHWPTSPMWTPTRCGWSSPPTRSPPQWTRSSGPDGGRYQRAAARDGDAGGRAGRPGHGLGSGLAVAVRPAACAVARARHQRPPRGAGRGRRPRRGGEPDRLHLRPPRGGVGPRHTRRRRPPERLGLRFVRAATPGTDPRFVAMVRDLVRERLDPAVPRARLGQLPVWDTCPAAAACPARSRGSRAQAR